MITGMLLAGIGFGFSPLRAHEMKVVVTADNLWKMSVDVIPLLVLKMEHTVLNTHGQESQAT